MTKSLVSVITPCYNGGVYLSETIKSVMTQTYPHWEMIIVDDGSTDGSEEIAQKYAANDSRIQSVRQSNGGSASARNRGIRMARGRYIALLDADDLWEPEFLERQLAFMKRENALCVFCSYRRIDENSREIGHPTMAKREVTVRDMKVTNQIGCLTGLYDTARHGKIYLHEELKSIRDDYAYWYDIVSLENRACGNPEVLASYRVFGNSLTGNKRKLIVPQYRFYRNYLGESVPEALLNVVCWGVAGIMKFS